jgi:hypothetical protein
MDNEVYSIWLEEEEQAFNYDMYYRKETANDSIKKVRRTIYVSNGVSKELRSI